MIRNILKTVSISLFSIAFLAASASVPFLSGANAGATKQPVYQLKVRNVTDGDNFDPGVSNSVTLTAGETAQFRAQVGNTEAGNDIDALRVKAFFTDTQNPTDFHVDIKADNLNWIGASVNVNVPNGFYLEYIPGSTVVDQDTRPEFFTRTNINDINGTSPLAFNDGMKMGPIPAHEHQYVWVYFKVKAVDTKPVVINPRLDLVKSVANISDGENLEDMKTATTVDPGETIKVRIVVKNGVAQSTLHNVVISDQEPKGNATPQSLTASVTSDEASTNKLVKININETQEVNVIQGTVVIKDLFGNTIKTLNSTEVAKLFGAGYKLGDIHGTFEFAKVIEYKAKASQVKEVPPTQVVELPDTGPGVGLLLLAGSAPVGLAIKRLRRKI